MKGGDRLDLGHRQVDGEEVCLFVLKVLPATAAEVGHHRYVGAVHPWAVGHFHEVVYLLLGVVFAAYYHFAGLHEALPSRRS